MKRDRHNAMVVYWLRYIYKQLITRLVHSEHFVIHRRQILSLAAYQSPVNLHVQLPGIVMTFDAVEGSLDPLSCIARIEIVNVNEPSTSKRKLAFLEQDWLLEHKYDLLPVRWLSPRTSREADIRSALRAGNWFHGRLVRSIREEFSRALLRWGSLSTGRRVVREKGIKPCDKGSDLGRAAVLAGQRLQFEIRVKVERLDGGGMGVDVLQNACESASRV